MTHIEQMIQDMCPNGVEWKTLGEVATLSRGKVYSKEYLRDNAGEYPVYSSQTANNGELGRISTYDYDGKYLTWTTDGAYAGTVFRREGRFSITNVCGLISNVDKALSIDFLYYWLNKVAKGYVYQGMGNPKLMSNVMETIEIPLPPLEIQKKIVECLDKFSALAAELQAELQLRRKQYEYYRTQLLTPHSDCNSADNTDDAQWQWKTLGEVCEMKAGIHINAADIRDAIDSEYLYPCFGGNGIRGYVKSYSNIGEYPIIGRQGALCGCVNYAQDKFYATEHAVVVKPYKGYSSRYLFHMLTFADLNQYKSQGAQPGLAVGNLKTLKYAFPPLAEQARIVAILDKFEKLITSMEEGIPAEQAAQQKRYEYYRDLLLTFDRKAV